MADSTTRILVAGPAWVGDMVMAQSLFITLKQQQPDCLIDVVSPAWSVPLLQRMPEVNDAIELPAGHKQLKFKLRYQLGRKLRSRHYDRAIILPRSYKSALVPFFSGAQQRTGYRGEMRYRVINDMRELDKSVLTQTVQRYVALGLEKSASLPPAIPYPGLTVDPDNQQKLLERLGLRTDKPITGFMPGAEYGPAKQWPPEYYAELAARLVEQGGYVWVFGSAKETKLGDLISNNSEHIINLCGRTQLVDVIDLIAMTNRVVSNDSGLMHVACATGRDVIAIYGSSTPAYTPPLSDNATVLYKNLECSPCFERKCRYEHYDCLRTITVDEVLSAISS